jgi:type I restriction enzyme S subunit
LEGVADVNLGKMLSPKAFLEGLVQLPYVRNENVRWFSVDLSDLKMMGFKESEIERYKVQPNDLLVCEGGEAGRCAVFKGGMATLMFQKAIHRVRVHPDIIEPYFIQYAIRHFIDSGQVIPKPSQTTIEHLPLEKIKAMPVPVPPLVEQRRIVAAIEEQFTRLDSAVAALQRAQTRLKRYRAAVLSSAVTGTLLGEVHFDHRFNSKQWERIESTIVSLEQGWSPKCDPVPVETSNQWGVIKTTAVQPMRFLGSENKRLPASLVPRPHLSIRRGDVLITRAGPRSRAAVACHVRESNPRLMVCDKVYRLRCNEQRILPAYLDIALNAPQIVDALDELKTGISDSGVNLTQQRFMDLRIPMPSIDTQRALVSEVERRFSVIDDFEAAFSANLKRADRLRQAILKRAFEGRLVPQDPADEPASALLERIKREHLQANGRLF